jgi:pyochelin biosynthesis protein PchC
MSGGGSGETGAWLRRYHESESGAPRLLCLPHAGGSASYFFTLSRQLSPHTETLAAQYPGRQDRRTEQPARRLERGPLPDPVVLIVSGRRAPSRQVPETVHLLDDAGVLAQLERLGGTEGGVLGDQDLVRMILPAVRADYRALADYAGSEERTGSGPDTVACPIVAMVGDADPVTPVDDALAWSHYTTGGFESEVFPGGHFYLAQRAQRVTDSIRRVLKTYA